MAFGDRGRTSDHHRNRLNHDDTAKAVEGCDEQEDKGPGNDDLGEFNRLGNCTAFPDGGKEAAEDKKTDNGEQVASFLGKVFQGSLGAAHAVEQSPHGENAADFGERNVAEQRHPVARARAVDHEEYAQPEKCGFGRVALNGEAAAKASATFSARWSRYVVASRHNPPNFYAGRAVTAPLVSNFFSASDSSTSLKRCPMAGQS